MNPVARNGIFIGYSQNSKGYRIYDHLKRKIVIARTVKFDEKRRGSQILREVDKIPETFDEILLGRDEQTNDMERDTKSNREPEGNKR